jgi:HNH endonuclease
LCNARVQAVIERPDGTVEQVTRPVREPAAWMMRQLRHRDGTCRFPGCDARRFTQAHHIRWWSEGGRTDLDNLVLICSFHHKLVHEHGWQLEPDATGELDWIRPSGVRYRAGPAADVA